MKRFLVGGGLVMACLLLVADAQAQGTGTIRGKVLDDKDQRVEGALMTLDFQGGVTRKTTTKTNKKGEYTQVGLPPGIYRVTATKEGYQGGYVDIRVSLGTATDLPDMKLVPVKAGMATSEAEAAKATEALRQEWVRAQTLAGENKYDEAIAVFQGVLAKNVSTPEEVHFNIAILQMEKKDYAAAQASFQKALELKPDHTKSQLELVTAYRLGGQTEKANELMAKAQVAGEGNAHVQYSTGVMHINAGKHEEAAVAFKKAIAIDPNHAESYYHLGTIALNQNNMAEAIADLEKYLSLNPTNTQNVATAQGLLKALKPAK